MLKNLGRSFKAVCFNLGISLGLGLVSGLAAPLSAYAAPDTRTSQPAGLFAASPTPNPNASVQDCPKGQCIIDQYVNPGIKALAAVVGVVVVLSIIIGGIQYAASADDPQKVAAAKQRIFKSLIALLAFFLLFRFLTYLIPGTPQ